MSAQQNLELVASYLESWKDGPEAVLSYFAHDLEYRDLPFPGAFSLADTKRRVDVMLAIVTESELTAHHLVASGPDTGISIRTDKFKIIDKWLVIECVGVGKVRDGKIVYWMDYWDSPTMEKQLADIFGRPVSIQEFVG